MWIRMLVTLWLGLALAAGARAAPEDDESLRDPRNILFEGIKSFEVSQLQKRLALDIDVQVAGHPKSPLPEFLRRLLPDPEHRAEITRSLLVLKANPRRPARDVLPVVFDRLWETAMRVPVEGALKEIASGKRPRPIRDAKIERTSESE